MLLSGIINNIFWAFVVAIILWILCAFAGKLVHPNYRMSMWLHLLCFAIVIPTVVLLTVVFSCNKLNSKIADVDAGIAKLLMADGRFVDRLFLEINQASSTKDTDKLTEYIVENFSQKISLEYPAVGKYVDVNHLLEKTDIGKQITKLTQSGIITGNVQEIMQAVVGELTKGIRSKIKSVRNKMLIALFILQTLPFGIIFYRASQHRSLANEDNIYESNDYL